MVSTNNDDVYIFKNNGNSTTGMNWQQVKTFSDCQKFCLTNDHVIIIYYDSDPVIFNVYNISDNFALTETFNMSNVLTNYGSPITPRKIVSDGEYLVISIAKQGDNVFVLKYVDGFWLSPEGSSYTNNYMIFNDTTTSYTSNYNTTQLFGYNNINIK